MDSHLDKAHANNKAITIKVPSLRKLLMIIGAVLLVLLSAFLVWNFLAADNPRADRYQAVFLDDNKVFFGKLKNISGAYLTLDNAYTATEQQLPADATKEQKAATANNTSLLPVSAQVYGPENTLKIRAEKVLFWQNLKADSKVAKAINSAK